MAIKSVANVVGQVLQQIVTLERTTTDQTLKPNTKKPSCDPILQYETFEEPFLERIVQQCHGWIADYVRKNNPRWLTLIGSSGVGKTHLARRIWAHAQTASMIIYESAWAEDSPQYCSYNPRLIHWPQFMAELRRGMAYDELRDMAKWPCLVLDDIGAERQTDFAADALSTLLCSRDRKWTILTANLTSDRLSQLDVRIVSRMYRNGGVVAEIVAQDYAMRGISTSGN